MHLERRLRQIRAIRERVVHSSRLAFIQAEAEYRQQEAILREQLLRDLGKPGAFFAAIVPTDTISVPEAPPALDVPALR